jgi:predicted nucleic acid-binding protein
MSSFGVVLDANVLFPASLRDILLRTAAADLYRLYLTDDILEETCRNLVRTGRMTPVEASRLSAAIHRAFPETFVTGHHDLMSSVTNQEKDRHVLAAAVKAGAQVIVTKNLKDFPPTSLAPFAIAAQSPDEFLVHLYDLDNEIIAKILIQQVNDLRKPDKTLPEVLDTLSQHAPTFICRVRSQFDLKAYSWPNVRR